ncbi:MAG: hypothetical protein M1296_01270 [Chloroflexi bacterium]|nr:hypothetical protein [Chloroflexota bacterium]
MRGPVRVPIAGRTVQDTIGLMGNTPMVRLNRVTQDLNATIAVKTMASLLSPLPLRMPSVTSRRTSFVT